ncbi:YqaE/Pmp3 family membrane protein [Hyphococcus sp.]|uniref:YqaE/Pmp3 family membrane protein n=1 Tax=Hyphococcus sp. TaxID=2038636 RepID=UPI003CCBE58D
MASPTQDSAGGDLLRVILSVILPPVGVAMEVGFSAQFWINVILTLLGYIPGVIHALWIILRR